ncbi:Dbl homology domain-containing protein [Microthyrium microscopicum]|uniref:Dbl homology domain-containing protein n=1 Tax=Microthyrium microscopicum TaxID=703497 RepID=A0A6A6UDG2_9PEZI|nr:Dbl homology domain-containing protein [Microthyrium microscopicum]
MRLQFARNETALQSFITRLQGFKSSISLILNILSSDSDLHAEQRQLELSMNVNELLTMNRDLSRRLMNLEDAFEVQTIRSKRQSIQRDSGQSFCIGPAHHFPSSSNFDNRQSSSSDNGSILYMGPAHHKSTSLEFEEMSLGGSNPAAEDDESRLMSGFDYATDLESSRVYRRAQRDTMDFSFRSSIAESNNWSIFSGVSLGQISSIAVIALPICIEDLTNPQYYAISKQPILPQSTPTSILYERSIFRDCLEIKLQLAQIPGFSELFLEVEDEILQSDAVLQSERTDDSPLNHFTLLKHCLNRGYPLLMLLKESEADPHLANLGIVYSRGANFSRKYAIYTFIKTCTELFELGGEDLISMAHFELHDEIGFLKVIAVVSLILQRLTIAGEITTVDVKTALENQMMNKQSATELIAQLFLAEERAYVSQLQELVNAKEGLERTTGLTGDEIHSTFGPLHMIINGQIRFLMGLEMAILEESTERKLGALFVDWSGIGPLYANFISREPIGKELLRKRLGNSQEDSTTAHNVSRLATAIKLLTAPSQRLAKYPGFLDEILQASIFDQEHKDIKLGIDAVQTVLQQINKLIKEQEFEDQRNELAHRVIDW